MFDSSLCSFYPLSSRSVTNSYNNNTFASTIYVSLSLSLSQSLCYDGTLPFIGKPAVHSIWKDRLAYFNIGGFRQQRGIQSFLFWKVEKSQKYIFVLILQMKFEFELSFTILPHLQKIEYPLLCYYYFFFLRCGKRGTFTAKLIYICSGFHIIPFIEV